MQTEITNLLGRTFTLGQGVHYYGIPCTIREIRNSSVLVDFEPSDLKRLSGRDRWLLSEVSAIRHGHPDFCRPRDHGVSMGCFDEAWK